MRKASYQLVYGRKLETKKKKNSLHVGVPGMHTKEQSKVPVPGMDMTYVF